jgi:hypothetical protein
VVHCDVSYDVITVRSVRCKMLGGMLTSELGRTAVLTGLNVQGGSNMTGTDCV